MVTNTFNADGSDVYTVEIDGTNNSTSVGGSISGAEPHTVNLAYYPKAAEGIKVAGCTVSDLTISGDDGTWVGADAGVFINMGSLATKQLGVDGADQDMILKSFSLNITNGVNRVGSNTNGDAEAYAFPEYVATGNIVVKYDSEFSLSASDNVLQSFLDGQTCTLWLKFGDGTVSSESEMNILAELQYTGDPTQDISENGIFWNIPFECVQNSSTEALKISLFSGTNLTAM